MRRRLLVTNESNQAVVAFSAELATGVWSRFLGLMGRRSVPTGEGLLLRPCSSVHTTLMRFPIDVVFMDGEGRVLKVAANLRPYWVALGGRHVRQALELPAGTASRVEIHVGDRLRINPD